MKQHATLSISVFGLSALLVGVAFISPPLSRPSLAAEEFNAGGAVTQASPLVQVSAVHLEPGGAGTYYFTLRVPQAMSQPLAAIRITPIPHGSQPSFATNASQAFLGDRRARGPVVPLASVGGDEGKDGQDLAIAFAEPVQPGSTVTVAVKAERNAIVPGVQQFGVTAYPVGDNRTGLYLGSGRVTSYGE